VSFEVASGEIVVLLGANGAGKTTVLDALSGVLPVAGGDVVLDGQRIDRWRRDRRARAGLAHVEQGRAVFRSLSVQENLAVGARVPVDRAYELFPALAPLGSRRAGLLSGGQQQMLVLARAVLTRPRYLLLDEMSTGLAPVVFHELFLSLRTLAESGIGVLLVEQFAELALGCGDRALVLSQGRLVLAGTCQELLADRPALRRAYLGPDMADVTASTTGPATAIEELS
jgi:branched-chain amino acid transport system ATP-binding protein